MPESTCSMIMRYSQQFPYTSKTVALVCLTKPSQRSMQLQTL